MSPQKPLIIEVRGNEFADRHYNSAVPYGADAIVNDALTSRDAGATVYHWHARGEDGVDRPNDVKLHRAITSRLRAESDLILHPTLGFTSTQGDAQGRVASVLELLKDPATSIDVVPVDFGAFITDEWDASASQFTGDDGLLVNKTAYLRELLTILRDNAIPVLAVVWSPGAVRSVLALRDEGLIPQPMYWQLGFTGPATPGGPPATQRQLEAFLEEIPAGDVWTVHVRDGDGLELAARAILLGGHVSVGLGDDPYERLGFPANADIVRRVAAFAELIGRPVATQTEARELTGLTRSR
jgi:uncharacterized protein (DUF849 family)